MTMVPVLPETYGPLKESIAVLERLKGNPDFHQYGQLLIGELVDIFFAFLSADDPNDLIRLQGKGQSVQRILGIVDGQLAQRIETAAAIDAQVEAIRQGRPRNAPPSDRPWRSMDHALIESRGR